jgi:hypothetical protein
MNKIFLLYPLIIISLFAAQTVQMTPEQENNWQIKVKKPLPATHIPLGEFITEVVTPPSLLHTISLPFEANVKKLHAAMYQKVSEGSVLAEVTGTEWIAIQQEAIANVIELQYYTNMVERKNILCKEAVIPQKECDIAMTELETYRTKVDASKALLESYGASSSMIETLFKDLKIFQTLKVTSVISGHIVELHATPGKSTSPSDALFIIQEKGSLWLEANIEASLARYLHEEQVVQITLLDQTFESQILQISPVINPVNQTRQIRLSLPSQIEASTGLRTLALFTIQKESLKVEKTSVIKYGDQQIVFAKTNQGYTTVPVNIIAEDDSFYYISTSDTLQNGIATDSIAILKNMLGGDDE